MAPSGRRPKTKPDDLGCESACTGCQKLHPPSPFIIITQPKSLYLYYRPTEGRRLSWPSWLVTYPDGLPVHRQSPTLVLTGSDVAQLRWWWWWNMRAETTQETTNLHKCWTAFVNLLLIYLFSSTWQLRTARASLGRNSSLTFKNQNPVLFPFWNNSSRSMVLCCALLLCNSTSSSYRSLDCIGLWSCLVWLFVFQVPLCLWSSWCYIDINFFAYVILLSWAWWDWPLTWLTNHRPPVLRRCWLGYLTHT